MSFRNGEFSCSPLIWKDLVIVTPGGEQGVVQAFQADSGKTAWKSALHGEGVYLSPSALTLLDTEQLITAVSGKIASLDPATGNILWEHPWKIFLNNAQIVQPLALSEDSFLLSAGYGKGPNVGPSSPRRAGLVRLKRHGSQRISKASSPTPFSRTDSFMVLTKIHSLASMHPMAN